MSRNRTGIFEKRVVIPPKANEALMTPNRAMGVMRAKKKCVSVGDLT